MMNDIRNEMMCCKIISMDRTMTREEEIIYIQIPDGPVRPKHQMLQIKYIDDVEEKNGYKIIIESFTPLGWLFIVVMAVLCQNF